MAIYSSSPKPICFFKVVKNAGRAIQRWIAAYDQQAVLITGAQASTVKQLHNYLGNPECLTFAVVRNPWDRVFSGYSYLREISLGRLSNRVIKPLLGFITPEYTFENFVDDLPSMDLHWKGSVVGATSQVQLTQGADIILRYETLNSDFVQIQKYLSYYEPLPIINVNNQRRDYHLEYNDRTVKKIAEIFAEDIEQYNYSFDDLDPWASKPRDLYDFENP